MPKVIFNGKEGSEAMKSAGLSELLGKTMLSVVCVTSKVGQDEIVFTCTDGAQYKLYHENECCERVYVEDIAGKLSDLVGSPILMADESSNGPEPEGHECGDDCHTWTFYRFATIKGYVDIRWLGESNGFYSEEVDFVRVD